MGRDASRAGESRRERLKLALVLAGVGLVAGAIVLWVVHYNKRLEQDGDAWLAEATDEARDWRPDAQLVRLEGYRVASDGSTPLLEDHQVPWTYEFVASTLGSEPRAEVVPGAPAPPPTPRCFSYKVSLSKIGRNRVNARGSPSGCTTKESIAVPVRCSIRQVWARAAARGAPDPAYAEIQLTTRRGVRQWHFEIIDHTRDKTMFSIDLPDDC